MKLIQQLKGAARPFTEAATYAGLAAALTALAVNAPPAVSPYMWYAVAFCTLMAVILKG